MKINKLPSEIFNRIAAGEVVESPASIVKELTENAIDAGATEVSVLIRNGGIDYIRVTDNGCGIDYDDMPTAFLPHATSKIKSIDDLDTICTLGFRGEALPSIAAVADVSMTSRPQGSEMAGKISYSGGKLVSHEECGAPFGSEVVVERLFDRIPARKKFLAKPSREETKIFGLIEHLALANPTIVFRCESESKKFASSGENLRSAVYAVYGDNVIKNVVEVELEDVPIKITGYTCVPSFTKPSRSYQNIIINGRYVESSDICYAITSVYMPYLMKRQYPLFVLHITMPYDMVDVNVHPSKLQVKFADTVKIKSLVAQAVKNAIMPRLTDAKMLTDEDFYVPPPAPTSDYGKPHSLASFFDTLPPIDTSRANSDPAVETVPSDASVADIQSAAPAESADFMRGVRYSDVYEPVADFGSAKTFSLAESIYIGKLFNTYLILERGDMCYFIDQHAAHEKILFDRLLADYESKRLKTQPLMLPFVFDVSPSDADLINENLELFEDCGFGITPFGEYTFTLSYVPLECVGIDMHAFVSDLLLLVGSREKSPMTLKERLMQAACKAAVKGEIDDLDRSEIDALLSEMAARNITLFCPHGRPIVVGFSKKEIEKWFKRIV